MGAAKRVLKSTWIFQNDFSHLCNEIYKSYVALTNCSGTLSYLLRNTYVTQKTYQLIWTVWSSGHRLPNLRGIPQLWIVFSRELWEGDGESSVVAAQRRALPAGPGYYIVPETFSFLDRSVWNLHVCYWCPWATVQQFWISALSITCLAIWSAI